MEIYFKREEQFTWVNVKEFPPYKKVETRSLVRLGSWTLPKKKGNQNFYT